MRPSTPPSFSFLKIYKNLRGLDVTIKIIFKITEREKEFYYINIILVKIISYMCIIVYKIEKMLRLLVGA